MPSAAASTCLDCSLGACPLYASTARSSNATAVLRNAFGSSVTPWKSNRGRAIALRPEQPEERLHVRALDCADRAAASAARPFSAFERSDSV